MTEDELIQVLRDELPMLDHRAIINTKEATEKFGTNTLGTPTRVDAAITVSQREQVGTVLHIANDHNLCICPLSTGNNWGYGSVNPVDDRKLIVLDLSQLNTISEIDKESGLIAVEPGVTQAQLARYLEDNRWDFMAPTTGAGPSCSILSNAIERGYGPSPYVDHFSALTSIRYYIAHPQYCNIENYSAIQTLDKNLNENNHSIVDASHKYGLGPYLDGLFTQSNLGIVTEISLRLGPKPEKFCSFFIKCRRDSDFENAVAFTKQLLKDKSSELGIVNLMDKRRVCAMVAENPNGKDQHLNMTDAQIASIAKQHDVAEWLIMGSIYATSDSIKATKKYIKSHAKFAAEVMFSDSFKIKAGKFLTKFIMKDKRPQLQALQAGIDIMLGKPRQVALPLAYWRNPDVEPNINSELFPDRDKCGLLWYAPLVPMQTKTMREFIRLIRSTTPEFGIEPLITFTNLSYDYVDSTVPLVFNLSNHDSVKKAHACLDKLFDNGLSKGFVPYRLSTTLQRDKLDAEAPHWRMTQLIKQALDPNNVINSERYNPK